MKKIFAFIIIISFVLFSRSVKAKDLSSYFNVDDVKLCDDSNCNTIYDEANGMRAKTTFLVKFDWSIHTNEPIEDGDIVTIPFANNDSTENSTKYMITGFSWTDVYDGFNNKIGQWQITGSGKDCALSIKFSHTAVGKMDLTGTFTTAKSIYSYYTYSDRIVPITVGNYIYNFKLKTYNLSEINKNASSAVNTSSNTAHISINSPGITIRQLYDKNTYPILTDDAFLNELYLEVPLSSDLNASIDDIIFYTGISYPTRLSDFKASSSVFTLNLSDEFTEIYQNNGESYEEFKARLNVLEYGIYNDINGKTIVVNFGNQPSTNLKYNDHIKKINPNLSEVGDYIYSINSFTVNSDVQAILNNVLGSTNEIGGGVVLFVPRINLRFPTVVVPTNKNLTSIWSYKKTSGEIKTEQVNIMFTLSPTSSIAEFSGVSQMLLKDKDSKNEIIGAKIKLQKKIGDNYEDIGEALTDSAGKVSFRNLDSGLYRYVQTEYLPHYKNNSFTMYSNNELTSTITSFEFDTQEGNIIYATNEREKYSVTYLPGEHGNFNEKTYINIPYGDTTPYYEAVGETDWIFKGWTPEKELYVTNNKTYTAIFKKMVKVTTKYLELESLNPLSNEVEDINENETEYTTIKKNIDNYEFVRLDGDVTGIRGENDIVVTYYYKKKESNLRIKYIDCTTNNEIADSTGEVLYYGDNYNADTYEESISIPLNYNRASASKSSNYKGVVNKDNINVEYCYNKKDSNINTSINLNGADKITSITDKISYRIDYSTVFIDYIGDAFIKVIDKLPYKIDLENSNLDGGIYNDEDKTITWNINASINSYNNSDYIVTKNIELLYKNIDAKQDVIINSVEGITEISNKEASSSTKYNTYIDIKGTIRVNYLENLTNKEIFGSIITENKVGKKYELNEKNKEGYVILKKPDNNTIEYTLDNQELNFLYERIKFKITTKAGDNGSITGDEEVYYGEDSTEDNIHISANEGYYIKSLYINQKEVSILENQTKLTIPKFVNMKEDKNIEVLFERQISKVIVPNTFKKRILYIIWIGIFLVGISIYTFWLYTNRIKRFNN